MTKKTQDALSILKARAKKNKVLRRLYEEEKLNYKIALAIRAARESKEMTQSELAKVVGTTQSVIARLEDAEYEGHSLTMLKKVADALDRRLEVKMVPIHYQHSQAHA